MILIEARFFQFPILFRSQDNMFRVLIDEKNPLKTRYRVVDALKGPVKPDT